MAVRFAADWIDQGQQHSPVIVDISDGDQDADDSWKANRRQQWHEMDDKEGRGPHAYSSGHNEGQQQQRSPEAEQHQQQQMMDDAANSLRRATDDSRDIVTTTIATTQQWLAKYMHRKDAQELLALMRQLSSAIVEEQPQQQQATDVPGVIRVSLSSESECEDWASCINNN